MEKEDTWEFSVLRYQYLEDESIFANDWEYDYSAYPWEVRVELKKYAERAGYSTLGLAE